MATTSVDVMDLEVMRKDDSSWHPCCISLSSSDSIVGIIVDYGNGDEDVIYDKEDALSRLRFRSTPLLGDDCCNVKEGDCVLALQKTLSKNVFIDAIIDEPKRVKHSRRVHCRCTFAIKWLNSELKGNIVIVPSKSILKFSDRSINEHPVFSSFLKSLSFKNGRKSPSVLTFSEESSCETEFDGILEKQVEEISKLVDGSITSFTDLFLEVKSAHAVKHKSNPVLVQSKSSKKRPISARRTTRSQNNSQIETEVTIETELKPVLSPLAARAAFSSLVHELPEKSYYFPGEEDSLKYKDSQQSGTTGITEHSAIDASSHSVKSTFDFQNRVLLSSNPSNGTNYYTSDQLNAEEKIMSHGFSTISVTREKEMKASKDYGPINYENSRNSVNTDKAKLYTGTRRLTRSMQKESEITEPARSVNKEFIASTVVIEKVHISNSSSFELEEEFVSDEDDENEGALSKKSPGSINGRGCTKSAKEIKKGCSSTGLSPYAKVISTHVNSTAETDSATERNEPATKRRTRSSREDYSGATTKDMENHNAKKRNHVTLHNASTAPLLRLSPRFLCPPKTRSQFRS